MKRAVEILIVLALVVLMVAGTVGVVHAENQLWYLSDAGSSPYVMYKGNPQPPGFVPIPDDGFTVWYSDETAQGDVTFPAGDWNGWITFSGDDATARLTLGYYDGSTFHESDANDVFDLVEFGGFGFTGHQFTVPDGERLAIRISDPADGDPVDCIITTGEFNGYIMSPGSDPGFPTPEISSIIMVAAGVAGLAGYAWFRVRRHRGKTVI